MTSPKALAERALELSSKATPGPWKAGKDGVRCDYNSYRDPSWKDWICRGHDMPVVDQNLKNEQFIAESRTLLPELATEVLKLLEENAVMRDGLEKILSSSRDNLSAAVAERYLGRGKFAHPSISDAIKQAKEEPK